MIDYHLHLVEHGQSRRFGAADVRAYARAGARAGLAEIAITEHLYRFPDVQDALGRWWADDPNPRLVEQTIREFAAERLEQPLAEYVDLVRASASEIAGGTSEPEAAVLLGLEVDLVPGRMHEVLDLLAPFDWDVLVGAVHWLGAWGFDNASDPDTRAEWDRRDPDEVWLDYVAAVEEMAASGACDVLAHLDLAKIMGVSPVRAVRECEDRLVKAAASNGLVVEINAKGWHKPVGEAYPSPRLLRSLHGAGVGVTLASDGHTAELVGDRHAALIEEARTAGFTEVAGFRARERRSLPLPPARGSVI